MDKITFTPGRELSRRFYVEGVMPLMRAHVPDIPYTAALIGPGSDVLGYDTPRSMDHDWGPRLTILLPDDAVDELTPCLDAMFATELPASIGGFPTRFREFAGDPGVAHMATGDDGGSLSHRVRIISLAGLLDDALGIRGIDDLDVATWMSVPEQLLLELTAGEVFRDDTGQLTNARAALAWYPDDVWRYLLAAAWMRISQIEPFIGRAAEVDDDLGSHVIAMSLVRDVMRLTLLQERRYAPYSKWLGTAFTRLDAATALVPHLDTARFARSWLERERGIVAAVSILAERQNGFALSAWIDPAPRRFHERPFTVLDAERFAAALMRSIQDPQVQALPRYLGGIDQFIDSTDALVNREFRMVMRSWLRA